MHTRTSMCMCIDMLMEGKGGGADACMHKHECVCGQNATCQIQHGSKRASLTARKKQEAGGGVGSNPDPPRLVPQGEPYASRHRR